VPGVGQDGWGRIQKAFDEMGWLAGRPWVMLSAGAGKSEFSDILTHAYRAGASGYLAGRAIGLDAFAHFPDWTRMRDALATDSVACMQDLNALTDREAAPWFSHELFAGKGDRFSPSDQSFRHVYGDFGS
jgi:tagatose 1,6-diphosphate aldolase